MRDGGGVSWGRGLGMRWERKTWWDVVQWWRLGCLEARADVVKGWKVGKEKPGVWLKDRKCGRGGLVGVING